MYPLGIHALDVAMHATSGALSLSLFLSIISGRKTPWAILLRTTWSGLLASNHMTRDVTRCDLRHIN